MDERETTYSIFFKFLSNENNFEGRNNLFGKWSEEVVDRNEYNFDNGIIGLGWLVSVLIQKGYLEGNADEILETVDDNIYKFSIKTVLESKANINSLLSLTTFYQQRLESRNLSTHFYRVFTHLECIKLLLSKLNFFLKTPLLESVNNRHLEVLLKYSYLFKFEIIEPFIEEAFYSSIEKHISYFEKRATKNDFYPDNKFAVSILKLLICVQQYNNPYWIGKIQDIYLKLKVSNPRNQLMTIWDSLRSTAPDYKLQFNAHKKYWETSEGQQLAFTLYTNLHSFEFSYA